MLNIHSGEVRAGFPAHSSDEVGQPTSIEFYAVLFNRRPVTARTPLRFATAHRFFAASEILFRPSALRPCRDSVDLAGGFSRLGPRACL